MTRLFGAQKYFYGPKGSVADTNITKFEGSVQSFIQDARRMPDGTFLDADIVCPVIAHLEMRSLFLRDELSRLADRVVVAVRDHFTSRPKLKLLFSKYLKENPERFYEFFQSNGVPSELMRSLLEFIDIRLPDLVDEKAPDFIPGMKEKIQLLQETLSESVTQAHIRSLETNFTEVQRGKLHSQLRYSVFRLSSRSLMLPDTGLTFFKESGLAPVTQKSDKVEAVLLPIAADVAIVGFSGKKFEKSVPTIQRALASCSYEAFIAQSRDEKFTSLAARISKNAQLISDGDLQRILRFDSVL